MPHPPAPKSRWRTARTLLRVLHRSPTQSPFAVPGFAEIYGRLISGATHAMTGRHVLERAERALPKGGRVLEVGAGTGLDAVTLATRRPDAKVIGSDLYETMLEQARLQPQQPHNVSWVRAGATELPFPNDHFDMVFSANSIKHFATPERALGEMFRVVKPGGLLMVTEVSPWVPYWETLSALKATDLPFLLRPVMALRLRRETRRLLPPQSTVERWFRDLSPDDFNGLWHPVDARGRPAMYWIAQVEKATQPPRVERRTKLETTI